MRRSGGLARSVAGDLRHVGGHAQGRGELAGHETIGNLGPAAVTAHEPAPFHFTQMMHQRGILQPRGTFQPVEAVAGFGVFCQQSEDHRPARVREGLEIAGEGFVGHHFEGPFHGFDGCDPPIDRLRFG